MGGEDRDNREAKQVSRERNNWSERRGGGGEEESEEESNTEDSLGISAGKERNPAVEREMVCGGRQRDGDCGGCLLELGFFYGGSRVGTVGSGDR